MNSNALSTEENRNLDRKAFVSLTPNGAIHLDQGGEELTAIRIQQILTYGLRRSPIRAHFQNIPKNLDRSQQLETLWHRHKSHSLPMLVAVHDPGHDGVGIGACADNEQDNHQE